MGNNQIGNTYGAFISYRHTEPDKTIAEKLHKMLETFRVPGSLVKKGCPKRIGRVFRDRDELPTSSNLADNIQLALEHSGYLIVICSPRTPQSQWVLKEIETFKRLHGHDHILALLIEGEPVESFPQQLRFVTQNKAQPDGTVIEEVIEVEPLAADIRDKTLNGMTKKLKSEILRLLAPILGCRYDDLKQRHRERMIKRVLTASISLSVFFLGFGSVTAYQSQLIKQQAEVVKQQSEVVQEQSRVVQAQSEQLKVEMQKTLSGQSLYLADVSKRLDKEGNRLGAILVALAALPENLSNPERPYLEEAEFALSEALAVYKNTNVYIGDVALEHDMLVNFIKLSPDGKTAVTSSQDGFLYAWDTQYGIQLNKLHIGDAYIDADCFSFLEDGLAVCSSDGKMTCIQTDTMKVLWEQPLYSQTLAVSPDKSLVACIMDDISVLEAKTGKVLFQYNLEEYLKDKGSDLFQYAAVVSFDDTGRYVMAGTSNGDVLVFDITARALTRHIQSTYEFVEDVAMSETGILAVLSNHVDFDNTWSKGKGSLQLFNPSSGSQILQKAFDYAALNQLSFNPDDANLLIFTEDEKINVFNVTDQKIDYTFISGDTVTAYKVKEKLILSSAKDGTIRAWHMNSGGFEYEPFRVTVDGSIENFEMSAGVMALSCKQTDKAFIRRNIQNADAVLLSESMSVAGSCYSADGSRMASHGFTNGDIVLWDMTEHKELARYKPESTQSVDMIRFFDGDTKLLAVTHEGGIMVFDAKTMETLASKTTGRILDSAVSPDGSLLAIAADNAVSILKTVDLSLLSSIDRYSFSSAAFYPDNSQVVLTQNYGKSGCYDVKTGELVHEFQDKEVLYAAMSQDGRMLAVIGSDNSVRLLNAPDYQERCKIQDFTMKAHRLFIHPDGQSLFVAMDDKTIRRYDAAEGKLLSVLEGWSSVPEMALFNDSKNLMAFVGEYSDTYVFHDSTNKLIAYLSASGINPQFSEVLTEKTDGSLFAVPFYSLEMLMKEAERQLGDRVLTPAEKEKYFIVD